MSDHAQAPGGPDPLWALADMVAERLGDQAPAGDGMVIALAGQVRSVSERVDTMGADVATLAPVVKQLGDEVAGLSKAVAEVTTAPPEALADWLSLGPDEADERWRELAYWIEHVLVRGYNISRAELPDCWPMHTTALVHLSWMFASYRQAYQPRANPVLAAEWSTKWLQNGLAALRGERVAPIRRCKPEPGKPGSHLADATQARATPAPERAATPEEKLDMLTTRSERAASFPVPVGAPPPPPPGDDTDLVAASDQPADRQWWTDYLDKGRTADLTWRRARAAAEEEAAR